MRKSLAMVFCVLGSFLACRADDEGDRDQLLSDESAASMGAETDFEELIDSPNPLEACVGFGAVVGWTSAFTFDHDRYSSYVTSFGSHGTKITVDTVIQNGQRNILLMQWDENGADVDWSAVYGTDGADEWGNSVVHSNDADHVYVSGRHADDFLVMKVAASDGSLVWARTYRRDGGLSGNVGRGLAVRRDATTGIVVAGTNLSASSERMVVLRLDSDGNVVWGSDYFPQSGAVVTDIPVALPLAVGGDIWVAVNHGRYPSSQFGMIRLSMGTGAPAVRMQVYPQQVQGGYVQYGDLLARADGTFIATYLFGYPEQTTVGVLRIDAGLAPISQWAYNRMSSPEDWGLSLYESQSGYVVGTGMWLASPNAYRSGTLELDFMLNPLAYYHSSVPVNQLDVNYVRPMARGNAASQGYLTRQTIAPSAMFIGRKLPGSAGCCETNVTPLVTNMFDVDYETTTYTRDPWAAFAEPSFERELLVPSVSLCE